MLQFDAGWFAIAGLAAAAGPVVIHLLNRRRFRTVSWGAMDFLREAIQQQRSVLQFRDLLLLILRILAVLCFGLALARPFWLGSEGGLWAAGFLLALGALILAIAGTVVSRGATAAGLGLLAILAAVAVFATGHNALTDWTATGSQAASARQPVHAILIVDNSRSMGAQVLGESEFERARARVDKFIGALPAGSRITVLPVAGGAEEFPLDGYRTPEDARRALERLMLTDLAGRLRPALELAQQAAEQVRDLPAKRVVLVTDLQSNAWDDGSLTELVQQFPGLQIAATRDDAAGNVWISQFELEDGVSSQEAPARFLARITAAGPATEPLLVQVRLKVDGEEVASQAIELTVGQERELEFLHQFRQLADASRPSFVPVELELECPSATGNQLLRDDRLALMVPVVAELPIVFVDQFGDDENPGLNRIGETSVLRHLLTPRTSDERGQRRLARVRHVRPEEVTPELLEDARLVVVAGVEEPGEMVPVLREYIAQGGPLVLLAGGNFNPQAWQEQGWLDGAGILPAPLRPDPLGVLPEESGGELRPFFVDFDSLHSDDFLIEQEDPKLLASLFEGTPFFKAARLDVGAETLEQLLAKDIDRIERTREPKSGPQDALSKMEPDWWRWKSPPIVSTGSAHDQAVAEAPRVLATFSGHDAPFVVERRMGRGLVVMFTSGVTSNWNLLRQSGAMYVFHRTLLRTVRGTLPQRNFAAGQRIALPRESLPNVRQLVVRPDGVIEPLTVEALGATLSGVALRHTSLAGVYTVETRSLDDDSEASTAADDLLLAVQAPLSESDLTSLSTAELGERLGSEEVRVLAADESLSTEGGARRGQGLWKTLAGTVLAALLVEMVLLALWSWRKEATA